MASDTNILNNILNIGRRRERAVYYRKDSSGGIIQTSPLPADPYSKIYYMMKGFTLTPPNVGNGKIVCPIPDCGFEAEGAFGLQTHLKKHLKKEDKVA